MSNTRYEVMHEQGSVPVKSWTKGVPFEDEAKRQLRNIASMPFIHRWVAAISRMPWRSQISRMRRK